MQVSELTGAMLDYWVARGWELTDPVIGSDDVCRVLVKPAFESQPRRVNYLPSSSWVDGGPIIELGHISVRWIDDETLYGQPVPPHWVAEHPSVNYGIEGATALEAAMRVYVASKFGDTVPDNE
ncbi:DUF2591 domain-containing protein (plasmid) [Burkholderia vietnamiensis]|uniref:DUF2591 domain-containing protein n=1 Tax=Burkholderia vietnamiensis (strain G4 / LMG 22486) TaxID=269482 RepID=A4JWA3_BURVG|nr:conserved hypothetical protein [Burkholderia vietnamiensis G4]MCB4349848.1 DUF2591 domain-containing protein [Burkholderia vietnamiensis]